DGACGQCGCQLLTVHAGFLSGCRHGGDQGWCWGRGAAGVGVDGKVEACGDVELVVGLVVVGCAFEAVGESSGDGFGCGVPGLGLHDGAPVGGGAAGLLGVHGGDVVADAVEV